MQQLQFYNSIAFCLCRNVFHYGNAASCYCADLNALTDARVGMIKAALQLTPEQEKYWPAVEAAIRARAKDRQARFERVAELRDSSPTEVLREQNAVELM